MSKIIDAVSVVFCYQDKVFTIKRQNYLKAFPGYLAFPGGKVDKIDHEAVALPDQLKNYPMHLVRALIRETKEEMSLDIESWLNDGSIQNIHYLGVAVTPDFNPVRFATHFFRLDMKELVTLKAFEDEAQECGWHSTSSIVANYEAGDILVVPPIIKLIKHLKDQPDLRVPTDLDFHYDNTIEVPMIESIKGVKQLPVLSNTLFPATRTNCFVIGDQNKDIVVIDPSPKDKNEYDKMVYVLKKLNVTKIMFTHHHSDHNEFGPELARDLKLPLVMSADTQKRLTEKLGSSWFLGASIHSLKEGDVLTQWLGEDVLIFAIPGHDEGHLGIAPKSQKWFIAGDLFQGIGTVVIGGAEGSMKKYFETLEKVIKLAPKAVYPSHGIALGGTYILEKTLEHRKMREDQVLTMYKNGKTKDEMLATIYFDVNPALSKYAMANIESHLSKLKEEGRLS